MHPKPLESPLPSDHVTFGYRHRCSIFLDNLARKRCASTQKRRVPCKRVSVLERMNERNRGRWKLGGFW
jgi:hypothetical protein